MRQKFDPHFVPTPTPVKHPKFYPHHDTGQTSAKIELGRRLVTVNVPADVHDIYHRICSEERIGTSALAARCIRYALTEGLKP